MTGLVAIGVISFVWEQHFQTYTASNMETLAETTASRIEERMEADSALTIKSSAALMPVEAALEVTPGIAIKVVDENDVTVFDSSNRINGIPNATSSFEPKDASKVALAKIVVDDKVVGSVRIWVSVSYTHLDVYKRQNKRRRRLNRGKPRREPVSRRCSRRVWQARPWWRSPTGKRKTMAEFSR